MPKQPNSAANIGLPKSSALNVFHSLENLVHTVRNTSMISECVALNALLPSHARKTKDGQLHYEFHEYELQAMIAAFDAAAQAARELSDEYFRHFSELK
jgi:hypothetical protein